MKKTFYLVRGLLFALTLFLVITALPAYAQQQPPSWRSSLPSHDGYRVFATPAKGIAAQKAAQFKQLHAGLMSNSIPHTKLFLPGQDILSVMGTIKDIRELNRTGVRHVLTDRLTLKFSMVPGWG